MLNALMSCSSIARDQQRMLDEEVKKAEQRAIEDERKKSAYRPDTAMLDDDDD
jgi:hypothetical protein